MVTATIGSAASHISATTLHSATGISIEDGDSQRRGASTHKKSAEWAEQRYLLVDEVSMLDRVTIEKLDKQPKAITNNTEVFFRGMNILFFSHFLQFPAVSHMDLYQPHPRLDSFGHILWRSLNAVVILTQQIRQAEDAQYAALLRQLRIQQRTDDDIALLNSRIGAPLPSVSTASSPVVTCRHVVCKAINNICLKQTAKTTGILITYCIADSSKPKKNASTRNPSDLILSRLWS